MNKLIISTFMIILAFSILGCSNSNNPIISGSPEKSNSYEYLPVGVTDRFTDGSVSGGMGILGLFEIHVNAENLVAESISIRRTELTDVLETVDITNFLQLAPCTDCVKVKSIALDVDNNFVVSIGIRHPFPPGDPLKPITGRNRADLHVFNIEGIVVSDLAGTSFTNLAEKISGIQLISADGYTGYLDGSLDAIFPTDATVHPYVLHFDDYSIGNFDQGNPMGFASVTDPPPSGNLVMAMGSDYDYKDYVFNMENSFNFIFAVGCTYAVSAASKSLRFTPEYRIPQHNKKAASEVRFAIVTNDLRGEDISSTAQIEVHVVDVSHGVTVGTALNEMYADSSVNDIYVDIPNVMSAPLVLDGSSPISGTGHDSSDPLVYQGVITNSLGALEGTYSGLIKITDNYAPGQNSSPLLSGMDGIKRVDPIANPLTGLFLIDEFATYQTFSIDIAPGQQIEVIDPNGGETLWMAMSYEIKWDPGLSGISDVKIEWSTDNFVADIQLIVASTPNDGSFIWKPVPVVQTTTAKIRITNVLGPETDMSDNDFNIALPVWLGFQPKIIFNQSTVSWGPYTAYEPLREYISPALLQTTTGYIYIGFYGISYGTVTCDCFVRSSNGTTWSGSGGMWNTGSINWGRLDNCKVAPSHMGFGWMMTSLWGNGWCTDIARANGGPETYTFDGVDFSYNVPKYPELATDQAGYLFFFGDNSTSGIWWNKSIQPGLIAYGAAGQLTTQTQLVSDGIISKTRSWVRLGQGLSLVYYTSAGDIKLAETTDAPNNTTWDTAEIVWSISAPYTAVHTPTLCADSQGRLFMAWVAQKSSGERDILASMRVSDGQPWSTPAIVTNAPNNLTDVAISSARVLLPTYTTEDVAVVSWNNGNVVYSAISPLDLMAFLPVQQVSESGDVARQQDSMCINQTFGYPYDVIFAYSLSDGNWDIAATHADFVTP